MREHANLLEAATLPREEARDLGPWSMIHECRHHHEVLLAISVVVDGEVAPPVARVALVGELCLVSAPMLGEVLGSLVGDGISTIEVMVPELRLCTAAGIRALLEARSRAQDAGGTLHVRGARGVVQRALQATGVDEVLITHPAG